MLENILAFEITMDDIVLVHFSKGSDELFEDPYSFFFRNLPAFLHLRVQVTSIAVLQR